MSIVNTSSHGWSGKEGHWIVDLYAAHGLAVLNYLTGRIGPVLAEDLCSQTFLTAVRRQASFDSARGTAVAWLFGIATNVLREHRRQERRYLHAQAKITEQPNQADSVEDTAVPRLDAELAIRRLIPDLLKLPQIDRDILLLASWAELEPTQIAQALDLPAGTVRSRLHRLRLKLRAGSNPPADHEPTPSSIPAAVVLSPSKGTDHE